MPMYNLIEYSDNYQDSSATLYHYKRDEPPEADAIADLAVNTSSSFKYKANLLGNIDAAIPNVARVARLNVKIVVSLNYLSSFFRSFKMPLINCKIKLNLTWKKKCVLSTDAGDAVFIINDTKLLLCQKKIIKILLINKIKVFNDLIIGTNIKQKKKMKIQMLIMLILLGILV